MPEAQTRCQRSEDLECYHRSPITEPAIYKTTNRVWVIAFAAIGAHITHMIKEGSVRDIFIVYFYPVRIYIEVSYRRPTHECGPDANVCDAIEILYSISMYMSVYRRDDISIVL